MSKRRFEFVPLWGMAVFFVYAMRRVWEAAPDAEGIEQDQAEAFARLREKTAV